MTKRNLTTFSQNPELKEFLVQTGEAAIVEASPFDRIWGIGRKADDERAEHPDIWQRENLLGVALMDAREDLRRTI